jgi:hypothetical protein
VHRYHKTLEAQYLPEEEAAKLGPDWSETYIPKEYPKWKFHRIKEAVIVKDALEEAALGPGWTNSQGAFDEKAAIVTTERSNPLRWVDEFQSPGLLTQHREKIKAMLLKAEAAFYRESPKHSEPHVAAMQLAFSGVVEVLFEARILTPELLENEIPALVWDSAIAGGWWHPASDERTDGFPDYFGHYWVWADHSKYQAELFRSEAAEWRAKLIEASLGAKEGAELSADINAPCEAAPAIPDPKSDPELQHRRKIRSEWLDQKRSDAGWTSDLEVAQAGGPTYNTIQRYRSGASSTRETYVRQKLANAFGCNLKDVPK